MKSVSLEMRVSQSPGVLKQQAGGTLVLFKLASGHYYAVNEVGSRVWDLCDGARTVREIADCICSEFDAPLETIQVDVLELLKELASEDLVESCVSAGHP